MVRCEICGMPAERHHIVSRGAGGVDDAYNVLWLCRAHHRAYHDMGWVWFSESHPWLRAKIVTARETQGKHTDRRVRA